MSKSYFVKDSCFPGIVLATIAPKSHCSLLRSRELFWWKWLIGQAVAALNFILNCRVMEQSGADENYIGGILACLGAQNTIQICRKMDLDLTIPNSLIGLPCLAGVAEC